MTLDGNEISQDTLTRVQALSDLFERAAQIWAGVPGAVQNAINDLQSEYALGQCVYWGLEAAQGVQERLLREQLLEAVGPNSPDSPTLHFRNEAGTPLVARLILRGDGYGTWNGTAGCWAHTHGDGKRSDRPAPPMVEFFDSRYKETPFGKFTWHRCQVASLLSGFPQDGELAMGPISWRLGADSRQKVVAWLREHPLLQEPPADDQPRRPRERD